jgi:hypothetical protein
MDAIKVFDELVARDREGTAASIPALREALRRGGAQYGGRDLVRVLRPKLVTSGEYEQLRYVCGVIMQAARRLSERILQSAELRAFIGLSEGEARLIAPDGLVPDPCVLARLDSFQTADGPKFVELNAEAPAGGGFGDVIADAFAELPVIQEFSARTGAFLVPNRDRLTSGGPASSAPSRIRASWSTWMGGSGPRDGRSTSSTAACSPTSSSTASASSRRSGRRTATARC